MGSGKPVVFVVLGLVGVVVAVAMTRKISQRPAGTTPSGKTIKILVASADIQRGQALILDTAEGKDKEKNKDKSKEQKPNVKFADWPEKLAPDGVVKEDEKEGFTKEPMVALADFIAGQRVFKHQACTKEAYVARDYEIRSFTVDAGDIRRGRYPPGGHVDIIAATKAMPKGKPFIECAEIWGLGGVGPDGLPNPAASPNTVIVQLSPDMAARLDAAKTSEGYTYRLQMAKDDCGQPKLAAPEEDYLPAEAHDALTVVATMEERLTAASAQAAQGQHADAIQTLVAEPRTPPGKMAQMVLDCRKALLDGLLAEAQKAFEAHDYDAAVGALDALDRYDRAFATARDLRQKILAEKSEVGRQREYADLMASIDGALTTGNLPAAAEGIEGLARFANDDFVPDGDLDPPAAAEKRFNATLTEKSRQFDLAVRAFGLQLGEGACERAREQLDLIRKDYPAHPDIKNLAKRLKDECGG